MQDGAQDRCQAKHSLCQKSDACTVCDVNLYAADCSLHPSRNGLRVKQWNDSQADINFESQMQMVFSFPSL